MTLCLSPDELRQLTGYKRPAEQLAEQWRAFVGVPDDMPFIEYRLNDDPPVGSGIYFLWSAADVLLYIGRSRRIGWRLRAHRLERRIPFVGASLLAVPDDLQAEVEAAHIEALAPQYNRKPERTLWEGHAAMVRRIRRKWTAFKP